MTRPLHHLAPPTARNRNRINNKSRLKIIKGSSNVDSVFPDEDDEKHRLAQSVAGVDQEDANEHHLQAVLSAAAASNQTSKQAAATYIPTPDSTGIVENYEQLYPKNRWRDPETYIFQSSTVEDCVLKGLAAGCTYYMDERDQAWLDKNNEEARGEGTSAQGSLSSARTSTRSKVKGKDPDAPNPVPISELEFELVMGLFEVETCHKTEFLHHSLSTGMDFPPYSDYHELFSKPLPRAHFAASMVPRGLPPPDRLELTSRLIYPHWRERRIERGGHRIIPTLLFDETDTLNEPYICFRRRENKPVRKTRASQANSADKLLRLKDELDAALTLAKGVMEREKTKKMQIVHSHEVWTKRAELLALRKKNPTLVDKGETTLLFIDREVPPIHSRTGVKIPVRISTAVPQEKAERPSERVAKIEADTDMLVAKHKNADSGWEDSLDAPYQAQQVPFASRLFKYIAEPDAASLQRSRMLNKDVDAPASQPRPIRIRVGRGGRFLADRREATPPRALHRARRLSSTSEDDESTERLRERWKFDSDGDTSAFRPQGSDEQDRMLVDDYDEKYFAYLRRSMVVVDADILRLTVDPTLRIMNSEGRWEEKLPYRLGMLRIPPHQQRGVHPAMRMQQQMMRISSNGGLRPPTQAQPPIPPPKLPSSSDGTLVDSVMTSTTTEPPVAAAEPAIPNGHLAASSQPGNGVTTLASSATIGGVEPIMTASATNGHQPQVVGLAGPITTNGVLQLNNPPTGLSAQQLRDLKNAFANPSTQGPLQPNGRLPYLQNVANNGPFSAQIPGVMNLKLPLPRPQWSPMGGPLRVNGSDQTVLKNGLNPRPSPNGVNGHSASPLLQQPIPTGVQSPSQPPGSH